MAFSMDVDELNREEVLQPLQPEPEVKEKIETQAESNVKEVMDVDLDSLAQRREFYSLSRLISFLQTPPGTNSRGQPHERRIQP